MSSEESFPGDDRMAGRGSPAPGCCILAAIVGVFGGLAVLYTVVGFYQNKTIGNFTQDTPSELRVVSSTAEQPAAAIGKLRQIETAANDGRADRILFTADDLNHLIASLDAAEDFRGNTAIERIDATGIVAEMALPMRKGIFDKGVRYLNATFVLEPELRARTIAFLVRDIRPKTGTIPKGFVDNYAALDFFKLDPENVDLQANFGALAAVYLEDGHLVVETKIPAEGDN